MPSIIRKLGSLSPLNLAFSWKKLFSEQGRVQLEKLALAPWASRRRQELLELLDRMNPRIEELTAVVELVERNSTPEVHEEK